LKGADYLVNHLNNLGWFTSNGMGTNPVSFLELKAYIELTNSSLTADECLLIIEMSRAYVAELNDKNPAKQSPHGNAIMQNNSFANAMKVLAEAQSKK